MPAPWFYLREDERVLLRQRASPGYMLVLVLWPVVVLTILLGLATFVRSVNATAARLVPAWAPTAGWLVLVALVALVAWRRAATTEYALTDQRIYARVGRLVTSLHFTTHDKITDIRYRQGPIERMLGLASLTFATAGAEVHVAGVRDALALKAASESARDAFVRELLREAPAYAPDVAPSPSPSPTPSSLDRPAPPPTPAWTGERPSYLQAGDAPVWMARPLPVSAVGSLRSLLGLIPLFFVMGGMQPQWRAWAILAALAAGGAFVVVRLAQLRRTEYVATDKRVYSRHGLVGTTVSQLTYDKITDITYHQDLLGRLFGYGTVRVQTAGGGQAPIAMSGLARPLEAKETIERWRDATLGSAR